MAVAAPPVQRRKVSFSRPRDDEAHRLKPTKGLADYRATDPERGRHLVLGWKAASDFDLSGFDQGHELIAHRIGGIRPLDACYPDHLDARL